MPCEQFLALKGLLKNKSALHPLLNPCRDDMLFRESGRKFLGMGAAPWKYLFGIYSNWTAVTVCIFRRAVLDDLYWDGDSYRER